MATGRPVVCFNAGGLPEVVGDCGFLVSGKKEFLARVEELLNNPELCAAIGKRASARAGTFNWDNVAKRTIDYFRTVLSER